MMQELLERTEPRVLVLLMGLVVVLFSTILVSYILWPQYQAYQAVEKTRTQLVKLTSKDTGLTERLNMTKQEVDLLDREIHGDMANLPIKQLESYIIGKLQKISWQTKLELISVTPGKGKAVQNFREILFEIEVAGTYFDYFEWLRIVGQELGFVVIKKFDITPLTRNKPEPNLNVKLTMVSYRVVQ